MCTSSEICVAVFGRSLLGMMGLSYLDAPDHNNGEDADDAIENFSSNERNADEEKDRDSDGDIELGAP